MLLLSKNLHFGGTLSIAIFCLCKNTPQFAWLERVPLPLKVRAWGSWMFFCKRTCRHPSQNLGFWELQVKIAAKLRFDLIGNDLWKYWLTWAGKFQKEVQGEFQSMLVRVGDTAHYWPSNKQQFKDARALMCVGWTACIVLCLPHALYRTSNQQQFKTWKEGIFSTATSPHMFKTISQWIKVLLLAPVSPPTQYHISRSVSCRQRSLIFH